MTTPLDRLRARRPLPLRGRSMLVTGAGSGIGRLLALGAADRGVATVHVWDRDADAAHRAVEDVRARGGSAVAVVVDVTDAEAVAAAAAEAGEVDVLVNNAGVVTGTPLLQTSEEGIRRTFEVNALAPYWTTRALLPGMIARRRGAVVTIASAAGLVGVARQTDYSASKHAAVGFAESLRAELRRDGAPVTSLVVCPFYVATGMFDGVRTRVPALLPILEPEQVAAAVLDAVEAGRERLLLPRTVGLLSPLRTLPVPVFDRVMDVLGVNHGMDAFTGRGGTPASRAR